MREGVATTSIWPSIYPELLRLVEEHRSTIVFVNNRRLAERLALRLNELARGTRSRAPTTARSPGSSGSRSRSCSSAARSPAWSRPRRSSSASTWAPSIWSSRWRARSRSPAGLQRIGRAGHELGATSKGRIFPKFRADLLESAVVAERMLAGEIEETVIPKNPLDVLAQQIVAVAAQEEIEVGELHDLVRGAYPFADLSRAQLENVLDMLSGRYPSDEFAELKPRIVWDRTGGTIRGREGARRLAVTNAGTIPDRGLFGVHLVDGGGRVGELDEEMVYEARAGQTFLLGASTWRIEEITRDRVLVSPAPGVPGAVPFWKGEGVGQAVRARRADRPSLARARRAFASESARSGCQSGTCSTSVPQTTCSAFLREQEGATGAVPSDRTIVVERFRDEIGDWRVCILTPFGARVHAPWAMAAGARLRDALGIEAQFDLVRRRHRLPPARRGRPAADRGARPRPRRARGPRRRRGRASRRCSARASARTPAGRC